VVLTASLHIEPSFYLFYKNLNKLVTLYKVMRPPYGINMLQGEVIWCMSTSVITNRLLLPIITTEKVLDKYSISHNLIV
jgi:hypothetical protein